MQSNNNINANNKMEVFKNKEKSVRERNARRKG